LTELASVIRGAVDDAPSIKGGQFLPALRSVEFSSCYVYSPHGDSYGSAASRLLCIRLKSGDVAWLPGYARLVREQAIQHMALSHLFAKNSLLVPVPGSTHASRGVWAAQCLALALYGVGLGRSVWAGIERRFSVRKSATALSTQRPTVRQHYESFAVIRQSTLAEPPTRLVLVDDVITKGRTILAAAIRLHEAFPNADIRAFALVRTMGLVSKVADALDPCQGVVRWAGGDARREP
jgi:hypothetical protein